MAKFGGEVRTVIHESPQVKDAAVSTTSKNSQGKQEKG